MRIDTHQKYWRIAIPSCQGFYRVASMVSTEFEGINNCQHSFNRNAANTIFMTQLPIHSFSCRIASTFSAEVLIANAKFILWSCQCRVFAAELAAQFLPCRVFINYLHSFYRRVFIKYLHSFYHRVFINYCTVFTAEFSSNICTVSIVDISSNICHCRIAVTFSTAVLLTTCLDQYLNVYSTQVN